MHFLLEAANSYHTLIMDLADRHHVWLPTCTFFDSSTKLIPKTKHYNFVWASHYNFVNINETEMLNPPKLGFVRAIRAKVWSLLISWVDVSMCEEWAKLMVVGFKLAGVIMFLEGPDHAHAYIHAYIYI